MGCRNTKNAEDRRQDNINRKIDKDQHASLKRQEDIIKLLLLGAGESGKSTIFKQMKILYGTQWDSDEMNSLRPVVWANIVQNLKYVLDFVELNAIDLEKDADIGKQLSLLADEAELNPELGKKIKKLWSNPGIQDAWSRRSNFQVLDCLDYYAKDIERITAPGYTPTQQDILQARVRTSGIVEEKFVIDMVPFVMFGKS